MAKMIFVNLPVSDLARSTAFYQAIGGEKNPQFSDDTASCMVFSETIYVMLLTHDKYRQFTSKKIADAKATSQVLICLSADSRDAVDDMVGKAQGAGGGADPGPKQDYGFMYGRSFEDPDGHHWEVMWMDVARRAIRHGRRLIVQPSQSGVLPMSKISPCLWFDGEAEEAANFYVSLLPDSRIEKIQRNTIDGPGGKAGTVLVIEFTLAGQRFMALNGGMKMEYTHAVSFKIDCADQAEVDRLWDALLANGGKAEQCGWLKDRYGVYWQIVPTALMKYIGGSDTAGAQRAMQAMLGMVKLDIEGLKRAYEGKSAA